MRTSAALSESKFASIRSAETISLQDLVRFLLMRISTSNGRPIEIQQDFDAEEIILDTEIDGVRYLFVRLPKSSQARVRLSPREQEIVRMVAQGHSNKIIADVLNIS
jgi:ATP/maltotriose-dependent transcriptional regulator MalT